MKSYWAPLLFFLFAYLLPLGWRPLVTPDEHRYALIPRAMLESGDWVQPRLLGLVYSEKPVLGYQMTAASFKIFGENRFALRLPAALAAGFCAFLLVLFIRRFSGEDKVAALGGLLFLAGGLVYGIGTFAVLDMQLTMFVTGTMVCFLPACLEPKFNRVKITLLLLSGVFAGLAFLTKGFLAFAVPAVTIAPFLIWEKRWKDFLTLPWLPLLGALLVAAPWSLLIHQADGDFWRYFIVEEHIDRFFGRHDADHVSPCWSLLPVLLAGTLPAGLLAPYAAVGLWGNRRTLLKESFIRYLLCYTVFPFLFFSASSGKLPTYILPCLAPLAALGAVGLALYFRRGGEHRAFRYLSAVLGLVLMLAAVLAVAGVLILPRWSPVLAGAAWLPPVFIAVPAGLAVLAWGALLWAGRKKPWRWPLTFFFAGLVPVVAAGQLVLTERALGDKTPDAVLRELSGRIPPGAVLVVQRSLVHAAGWALEREDIVMVASAGELEYGLTRPEGEGRFLRVDEYNALLNAPDRPPVVYLSRESSGDYIRGPAPEHETIVRDQVLMQVFPARSRGENQ